MTAVKNTIQKMIRSNLRRRLYVAFSYFFTFDN
jgi:hypothetical protein